MESPPQAVNMDDSADYLFILKRLSSPHDRFDSSEIVTRYSLHAVLRFIGCRQNVLHSAVTAIFAKCTEHAADSDFSAVQLDVPARRFLQLDNAAQNCWGRISEEAYFGIVGEILRQHGHSSQWHKDDVRICSGIIQRRRPLIILVGGTSGVGKSTLGSLIAARCGMQTVLSTDTVRHVLRSIISKEDNPCLFVSTYLAVYTMTTKENFLNLPDEEQERLVVKAYSRQCQPVLDELDRLLTMFERRREAIVIEGVHLSMTKVKELADKHPNVVPFLVGIRNEDSHRERFAIRSKNMNVSASQNKYIKNFANIRRIQNSQLMAASDNNIPIVDNTNIDRSVQIVHSSILRLLRVMDAEQSKGHRIDKLKCLSKEFQRTSEWSESSISMRILLGHGAQDIGSEGK